ncbi:PH domain-containing protein [Nonlabens ponticola]|uniref:Uncharacterized protein YyaB-like PH domain-containing protein n=1 Tax=Nonlabens ponticola TaxID=2496866 RepID=A0A3S9MXN3_9FLAO|nr:PH domain-containing protein [Nonlabens ponticola]AZQ43898.1 hypothetical protein EJ995_06510 [Nonlabens ponticola]
MRYRSKKGFLMILVVVTVCSILFYLMYSGLHNSQKELSFWIPSIVIMLIIPLLLLWILFQTYYKLGDGKLKYVSGPLRGSIEIKDINRIIKNTTLWVGLKPATARNGIIIKYGSYDELYISPKRADKFIEHLLELNPEIIVSDEEDYASI